MSKIKPVQPVKLVIGLIFKDQEILKLTEKLLNRYFGKIDFQSPQLDFNYTDYYREEIGEELSKKFLSFEKLIAPEKLSEIKILTNRIEEKFQKDNKRRINIDPGYLDLARFVLATTKDFSHRIYLNKGIYAEITLLFKNKQFIPQPWTYPDYKSENYNNLLCQIREIYKLQTCSQHI